MTILNNGENPSPDRITLFPHDFPDELHASQTGRLHYESGNLSTQQTFLDAYGTRPFRLTQWIPSHLEAFAQRLPGDPVQNLESLLRKNTLFPLFETFGNAQYTVESSATLRMQTSRMHKRLVGESGNTRLCTACLMQDREEYGTPYIHRSHQIPGVNVCWRHNLRLLSACPFCACPFEPKADMILAPWVPCPACHQSLYDASFYLPDNGTEREHEFALFAHQLLQVSQGPLSGKTLARLYGTKLREAGYARGTLIDRTGARKAIEAHYGMEFMRRVDAAIRNDKDRQWVRSLSHSGMHDTPLSRHLLLANFLFGSAAEFTAATQRILLASESTQEDAILSNEVTTSPSTKALRKTVITKTAQPQHSSTLDTKPLAKASAKLIAYLTRHPQASISDLWAAHHGAMKRIAGSCMIDDHWLERMRSEAILPAEPTENTSPSSPDDLEFAKKIAAGALAQLASIDKPTRMTRSFLLRQIGWKQGNFVPPERYPLTNKKLDEEVESEWHYYARRMTWAILTLGDQASTSPWRVIELSGVEYHRAKLLSSFFSELSPRRRLRTGTITDVLSEYQISTDWKGPNPEQEFRSRGRKHQRRPPSANAPDHVLRHTSEPLVA